MGATNLLLGGGARADLLGYVMLGGGGGDGGGGGGGDKDGGADDGLGARWRWKIMYLACRTRIGATYERTLSILESALVQKVLQHVAIANPKRASCGTAKGRR